MSSGNTPDGRFIYIIVLSLSELCSFVHFDSLSPLHSWRRAPGRYGYGLRKSATFKHQFSRSNTPETPQLLTTGHILQFTMTDAGHRASAFAATPPSTGAVDRSGSRSPAMATTARGESLRRTMSDYNPASADYTAVRRGSFYYFT